MRDMLISNISMEIDTFGAEDTMQIQQEKCKKDRGVYSESTEGRFGI